jgi:hypothetical protein
MARPVAGSYLVARRFGCMPTPSPFSTPFATDLVIDGVDAPLGAVLHDFAAPILLHAGAHASEREVKEALQVAVTVWNSLVLEQWGRDEVFLQEAKLQLRGNISKALIDVLDVLVLRKKTRFAHESRPIAGFQLKRAQDGGWLVQAEPMARAS